MSFVSPPCVTLNLGGASCRICFRRLVLLQGRSVQAVAQSCCEEYRQGAGHSCRRPADFGCNCCTLHLLELRPPHLPQVVVAACSSHTCARTHTQTHASTPNGYTRSCALLSYAHARTYARIHTHKCTYLAFHPHLRGFVSCAQSHSVTLRENSRHSRIT